MNARLLEQHADAPLYRRCEYCGDTADKLEMREDGGIAWKCRTCNRVTLMAPQVMAKGLASA